MYSCRQSASTALRPSTRSERFICYHGRLKFLANLLAFFRRALSRKRKPAPSLMEKSGDGAALPVAHRAAHCATHLAPSAGASP
jgi:hypothetical protein